MVSKISHFTELVKIEHSLFALPFGYLGLFAASAARQEPGWPDARTLLWVTLAMVGIRTVGMCANRLVDRDIDRANPRTACREAAIAALSVPVVLAASAAFLGLYFYSASRLNRLCFALSPVPVALVSLYPYLKRWTWLAHFVLGIILACAPIGGWIASSGAFDGRVLWLAAAVALWVSGFDVLYALQDVTFDRQAGLFSIPRQFGERGALAWTRGLHISMMAALAAFLASVRATAFSFLALALVAVLLARQHGLVERYGLARLNEAFFTLNAGVGWILLAGALADRWL